MEEAAQYYGRKWLCTVDTVPKKRQSWKVLCEKFNPLKAPQFPPSLYDLMEEMMQVIDSDRISAEEALKQPFFTQASDEGK